MERSVEAAASRIRPTIASVWASLAKCARRKAAAASAEGGGCCRPRATLIAASYGCISPSGTLWGVPSALWLTAASAAAGMSRQNGPCG